MTESTQETLIKANLIYHNVQSQFLAAKEVAALVARLTMLLRETEKVGGQE